MCQTCRSLVFLELKQLYKQPLTFLIEKTYFSFPESFFFCLKLYERLRQKSGYYSILTYIDFHHQLKNKIQNKKIKKRYYLPKLLVRTFSEENADNYPSIKRHCHLGQITVYSQNIRSLTVL